MAEVRIVIKDVGEPKKNEIDVSCVGDILISKPGTPAQSLANRLMKYVFTILET